MAIRGLMVLMRATISVLGLSLGFGLLFANFDQLARWGLASVPAGFLLSFSGSVATAGC
jgi:hypothetical protein